MSAIETRFEKARKKYRLFELTDPKEFEKRVFEEVYSYRSKFTCFPKEMTDNLINNYGAIKGIGYKKDCSVYEEVQSEPSAETNGGQGVTSTNKSDT